MTTVTDRTLPRDILMRVEKPARYIGREANMVLKDTDECGLRFCFCFPDVYEVGMSHLGLQIIYFMLNDMDGCFCERAFAPWPDLERILRDEGRSLFSLETFSPLKAFDILGFTLQYEMSYTNILNMLELSGIPFPAEERDGSFPLICGGGPCAYNPEPLAPMFDFFYIGEAEACLPAAIELCSAAKAEGLGKEETLAQLMALPGIYVPRFYEPVYDGEKLVSFGQTRPDAPAVIRKNAVMDMDKSYYPDRQLVPLVESVHDRVTAELFRGCLRGCRFCQAGFICRPVREKSPGTVFDQAEKLVASTGHEEISMLSLSTSDYGGFKPLTEALLDRFSKEKVNLALPSLRIDAFNLEVMSKIQAIRKSSLTFAPEAGTQRMRDVINKNISEDEILNGAKLAFTGGWTRLKLYFMVGLPGETAEDVEAIAGLSEDVCESYFELPKEKRGGSLSLSVSASCFVPKPFTPFQWAAQDTITQFEEKCRTVKRLIKRKQIKFNYHEAKVSMLECVFARGDRRVFPALVKAFRNGARFDSWLDKFNFAYWQDAFTECGIDPAYYANRRFDRDELLPWDFIDIGVTKEYLLKEAEKAERAETTRDCRTGCNLCGAESFGGGICFERV